MEEIGFVTPTAELYDIMHQWHIDHPHFGQPRLLCFSFLTLYLLPIVPINLIRCAITSILGNSLVKWASLGGDQMETGLHYIQVELV